MLIFKAFNSYCLIISKEVKIDEILKSVHKGIRYIKKKYL